MVAEREQRALDEHREVDLGSRAELVDVHVPAVLTRRLGAGRDGRLVGAETSEQCTAGIGGERPAALEQQLLALEPALHQLV